MATRLDSKWVWHHAVEMRTTVTLDEDVERLLREATHRSRSSFKETLNQGEPRPVHRQRQAAGAPVRLGPRRPQQTGRRPGSGCLAPKQPARGDGMIIPS